MPTDPIRPLRQASAPDQWADVVRRAQDPDPMASAELLSLRAGWRRFGVRTLVAAAAVLAVVMVSVAALGSEDQHEKVTADQPGEDQDEASTTTVTTSPSTTGPATTVDGPSTSSPSTTTPPGPGADTPGTSASSPPASSSGGSPSPTTTAPTPTTIPPGPPPSPDYAIVPTDVCPSFFRITPSSTLDLRPGPSPIWSVASSTVGDADGTDQAPDGSWPPTVVVHGAFLGVSFELGIGIGVTVNGTTADVDMSSSLAPTSPPQTVNMTGSTPAWPGPGYIGRPSTPGPNIPPEQALHLPPVPEGRAAAVAVTLGSSSTGPICDNVYIAAVAEPGGEEANVVTALSLLVSTLGEGSG